MQTPPPGGPEVTQSGKRDLGCPEGKPGTPRAKPWVRSMQIIRVALGVLGSGIQGGACTIQAWKLGSWACASPILACRAGPLGPKRASTLVGELSMRGRRPGALQLGWSLLVPGRGLRGVGRASSRLQEGRG